MVRRIRFWVQAMVTMLTNGYAYGFINGTIYTGDTKRFCVPGLNCYSCPGALGACPLGALQAVLSTRNYYFSYYVTGFLFVIGALMGRLVCGWMCPFGLFQDLLYRLPFPGKMKSVPGENILKGIKYIVLAFFVVLLPLFALDMVGQGSPWFCKYICPAGTLEAGIPLTVMNKGIREAAGWLFTWKAAVLAAVILASILVSRPFCRYVCPLGAIYGFFNRVSLYQYHVDEKLCTRCGECQTRCPMNVKIYENTADQNCIRCGECKHVCPQGAVSSGWKDKKDRSV